MLHSIFCHFLVVLNWIYEKVASQREKNNSLCRLQTAHNWTEEKERCGKYDFMDNKFSLKSHLALSFLVTFIICLSTIKDPITHDVELNSRGGIYALLVLGVWFGMIFAPDGPFLQPHPLIWRLTFVISIIYELSLIYILFQVRQHLRKGGKWARQNSYKE